MRFFIPTFLILIAVLYSCENDSSPTTTQTSIIKKDSTKTQNTDYKNDAITPQNDYSYQILGVLSDVEEEYLPKTIIQYFKDTNSVDFKILDNNSAGFTIENGNGYTQVKAQYLNSLTGLNVVAFCQYTKDNNGFKNLFYFVQKGNKGWSNVTQLLVNRSVLNFLEKSLNSEIFYTKTDGIYSYSSDYCDYALLFDFSNNSSIYLYIENSWQIAANIAFKEGAFEIAQNFSSNAIPARMLNSKELDICKRYYNLSEAIKDSSEAYILDFSRVGLKSLNKNIVQLKRLQILILDDNYLKELPEEVCDLLNLQVLRANNNKLKELPSDIGLLKNIEEISASYNNIEYVPASLSKASALKLLSLDNNSLNSINIDLSGLSNLVVLNLSNNNITSLPSSIGSMVNLVSLDISNNPIENLPAQIYNLKHLEYVDVTNTMIPDDQIVKLMGISEAITVIMD